MTLLLLLLYKGLNSFCMRIIPLTYSIPSNLVSMSSIVCVGCTILKEWPPCAGPPGMVQLPAWYQHVAALHHGLATRGARKPAAQSPPPWPFWQERSSPTIYIAGLSSTHFGSALRRKLTQDGVNAMSSYTEVWCRRQAAKPWWINHLPGEHQKVSANTKCLQTDHDVF